MTFTLIPSENYKSMPWKNGLGVTREIAISPSAADFSKDPFDWRISLARVERDGDFSQFPGYRRWLTVIEGAGLRLARVGGPDHGVTAFAPYEFSGEYLHQGFLLNGPILDLSVFAREGRTQASVECREWTGDWVWTSAAATRFVVALGSGFGVIAGTQAAKVKAGDSLRIDGAGDVKIKTSPGGGRMLLIALKDISK